MRSDDILKSIKKADKKYIELSDADSAKEFFEKRKVKSILSVISSTAAIIALSVFVGINIYNINVSKHNQGEITDIGDPGRPMLIYNTDIKKAKAAITVKTYKKDFVTPVSENTFETDEYKYILPAASYDGNGDISYLLNGLSYCSEFEDEYVMAKADRIIKYENGEVKWSYYVNEGAMLYYTQKVKDGVIYEKNNGEIGFFDSDGKLKWKSKLDAENISVNIYEINNEIWFWSTYVLEVAYTNDKEPEYTYSPVVFTAEVFSSDNGELLYTKQLNLGVYGINSTVSALGATEEGFIFCTYKGVNIPVITIIGFEGECRKIISFEDENRKLNVTSAEIKDNTLYLSGTAADRNNDMNEEYNKAEIYEQTTQPLYLDKLGHDYYIGLLSETGPCEKTATSSFMLAYSLDSGRILSLHTVDNSYGGRVRFDNSADPHAVCWDTIAPKYERKAVFNEKIMLQSDEGRANTLYFDENIKAQTYYTQGGVYALVHK